MCWFSFQIWKMWLSTVGSFYLCLKIREIKQREWQQQLEPRACVQTQFIHKTWGKHTTAAEQLGEKKKKKKNKPTTPSELMNNVATKELKSISGVRNTQA